MRATVTGATGLLGRALLERLDTPHVLTRDPDRTRRGLGDRAVPFGWRGDTPPPNAAFEGRDTIVHLAGEPIAAKRWTPEQKRRIRDSRRTGTRSLVDTLLALPKPPKVLISASGVGIYGNRGDERLDERSSLGNDFLAEICRDWEREAKRAESAGIRVVSLRIGMVLSTRGGALQRMLLPFRLGLGGRLGDGHHHVAWIHIDDVVGLVLHAAEHDELRGPVNVVAPSPVTNREFTRTLAHVLRRPAVVPAPRWALRLVLGELADAVVTSQRAQPTLAQATGYQFKHPSLEPALRDLIARRI